LKLLNVINFGNCIAYNVRTHIVEHIVAKIEYFVANSNPDRTLLQIRKKESDINKLIEPYIENANTCFIHIVCVVIPWRVMLK